jgi:hypothetical protein
MKYFQFPILQRNRIGSKQNIFDNENDKHSKMKPRCESITRSITRSTPRIPIFKEFKIKKEKSILARTNSKIISKDEHL